MNKGIAIRNKKWSKNTSKRNRIKPEQENLCRFLKIRYQVIEKINGKFRHTGSNVVEGLQIKNRVYLLDGHYKLINNRGVKIVETYDGIPEWANDDLKTKYEKFNESVISIE